MKDKTQRLDKAYGCLREEVLPPVPSHLEQNVWRSIRQTASEALDWRPAYWPQWITKPAFAASFGALSLISGLIVATKIDVAGASITENAAPLQWSVFTENAPGMLRASIISNADEQPH